MTRILTRPGFVTAGDLAAAADESMLLHAEWFDGAVRGKYHERHLAGAIAIDTDLLEDGRPTWRLRPRRELRGLFGELGIDGLQPIVVTGESVVAAARLAWVLHFCGAANVALFANGCADWQGKAPPETSSVQNSGPAGPSRRPAHHSRAACPRCRLFPPHAPRRIELLVDATSRSIPRASRCSVGGCAQCRGIRWAD